MSGTSTSSAVSSAGSALSAGAGSVKQAAANLTLSIKPASSPSQVTKIVTSKEWVLPPRPKPGRKPSADTPATKRKAQNRAAQRAFRERRATRVSELEAKLSEVEKEKEMNEMNFTSVVNKLQMENKMLMKALNEIKSEYSLIKKAIDKQSQSQPQSISGSSHASPNSAVFSNGMINAPSPLNYFQPSSGASPSSMDYKSPSSAGSVKHKPISPAPPRSPAFIAATADPPSAAKTTAATTPSHASSSATTLSNDFDCGVCEKDDCVCADVGIKQKPPQPQQPIINIDTFKPLPAVSLKRKPASTGPKLSSKFKKFKRLNQQPQQSQQPHSIQVDYEQNDFDKLIGNFTDKDFDSPIEQCGFCSDDSPCVCREAAKEAANAITELQNRSRMSSVSSPVSAAPGPQLIPNESATALPPIEKRASVHSTNTKLPVLHPGPSVEITEAHRSSISTPIESPDIQDFTTSQAAPSLAAASGPVPANAPTPAKSGCTGNPGTCTQCQMDPMSTLFCTTIASKAEEQQDERKSPVSPPISNPASKVSSPNTSSPSTKEGEFLHAVEESQKEPKTTASTPQDQAAQQPKGIFIPCADAYKTLSRHKKFHTIDFSTLVGKLTTRGMQVEAQSVANVLRELDRRLYS